MIGALNQLRTEIPGGIAIAGPEQLILPSQLSAPLAQLAEQLTLNQRVAGSSPAWRIGKAGTCNGSEASLIFRTAFCGRSSVVERHVANVNVEGSTPFARFLFSCNYFFRLIAAAADPVFL